MVLHKNHFRWLAVFTLAAVLLFDAGTVFAQKGKSGFSKTSRGGPSRSGVSSSARNRSRGNFKTYSQRGNSYKRGNSSFNSRNFNSKSFNSRNFSSSNFRGSYFPSYSYNRSGIGFGGSSFGLSTFRSPIYGYGINSGFNSFNPVFSTYGTYLGTGGVVPSNVLGSSAASQALQQLQNQQQLGPNTDRDAEILRLQIELERAKQELANQNLKQEQRTLKPAVADSNKEAENQKVIDNLGLAPIIETNQLAAASHLKAERAFRYGEYGQAARFSGLSRALDESNGKLLLFGAQAHFANGEYADSVTALAKATSLLPTEDIGWVVENFKLFYGHNDFVSQMKSLSTHLKQSPNDASAWLLRGYQYGALGYPQAAKKDFSRARDLGADSSLVDSLETRFGGEVVAK